MKPENQKTTASGLSWLRRARSAVWAPPARTAEPRHLTGPEDDGHSQEGQGDGRHLDRAKPLAKEGGGEDGYEEGTEPVHRHHLGQTESLYGDEVE
jgi:hypothetical protein